MSDITPETVSEAVNQLYAKGLSHVKAQQVARELGYDEPDLAELSAVGQYLAMMEGDGKLDRWSTDKANGGVVWTIVDAGATSGAASTVSATGGSD